MLWLDPQAALSDVERMVLSQSGWNVRAVPTLEDVAFQAPHALAVEIGRAHV